MAWGTPVVGTVFTQGAATSSTIAYPATVNAGDLLVLYETIATNTATSPLAAPSGSWTTTAVSPDGSTALQVAVSVMVASGTEGGTNLTRTRGLFGAYVAQIVAYPGGDSSIFDAATVTLTMASGVNPHTMTQTSADAGALYTWVDVANSTTGSVSSVTPSGTTTLLTAPVVGTITRSVQTGYYVQPSAGSQAVSLTWSSTLKGCGVMVVLKQFASTSVTGSLTATAALSASVSKNLIHPRLAIVGDSLTYRSGSDANPPSREATTRGVFVAAGIAANADSMYWYGLGGKPMSGNDSAGHDVFYCITAAQTQLGTPDIWVVGLGTNDVALSDAAFIAAMQAIMVAIGSTSRVYWMNLAFFSGSNTNALHFNPIMASTLSAYTNATLLDWNTYIHSAPVYDSADWISPVDATHMTAQGWAKRDAFIASQIAATNGNLTATAALSATVVPVRTASGSLTATGALSAVIKVAVTGTLSASGALSALVGTAGSVSGSLTATASLSATVVARIPVTGTLAATAALSGSALARLAVSGTLAADATLSATVIGIQPARNITVKIIGEHTAGIISTEHRRTLAATDRS